MRCDVATYVDILTWLWRWRAVLIVNTISTPSKPTRTTRALILLDITNMFNEISRDACRLQLHPYPLLRPMLPYFDLIYAFPNIYWYEPHTGQHRKFEQTEGFALGCPLGVSMDTLYDQHRAPTMLSTRNNGTSPSAKSMHRQPQSIHPPCRH
jgi:hypothetical protein